MKKKYINYFKKVVEETSKLSTCISKQVGAVLVKDTRIIAIGYNGVPSHKKHCNKIFKKDFDRKEHHIWSFKNELHAEQNLICFCAKNGLKIENCSLFISLSPCINCAKMILAAGIKDVYYLLDYDLDNEGLNFLNKNKIKTYKIK